MAETFLLKNIINPSLVQKMGENLHRAWNGFDRTGFEDAVIPRLEPLALTERSKLIREQLEVFLPSDFERSAAIMLASFGPENTRTEQLGYDTFYYLPFGMYVASNGLGHFETSMTVLCEITKRFTAEFPVRVFIERHPQQTMARLRDWASHENPHVRRLVSEGTRPRLPWASRLPVFQRDPAPVLELLELLKEDPELYVRRSVANNLNDIGKDHPDLVVQTLERWNALKNPGTRWIVKHASRSLVKSGHAEALRLLGYDPGASHAILDLQCSRQVIFGEALEFSFRLRNDGPKAADFMVDFVVYFRKANGKLAPKVFKLASKRLKAGEELALGKKHPIKPITTRAYYGGMQRLALQVNGIETAARDFELILRDL